MQSGAWEFINSSLRSDYTRVTVSRQVTVYKNLRKISGVFADKVSGMWYVFYMRKKIVKLISFILLVSLIAGVARYEISRTLTVKATTMSELEEEIRRRLEELAGINSEITALEAEQDLILEQMEDLNSEIINMMASIGLMDEEIAEKGDAIAAKEGEISDKQDQIVLTAAEYEAARQQEEDQRLDMAVRTRLLYEEGNDTYLSALMEGQGLFDILNRMDYIEKIFEYNKMKLDGYIEMKEQIQALWDLLEQEKAELEQDMLKLESDKADLQKQKSDLESQKASLNVLLEEKKKQSKNYDAEINKARQEAAVAQKILKQNQDELKRLQAAQTASNTNYTSGYDSLINKSAGTDLGKKIANFACQYIGNPYVAGGISLTNGADCSGFTYAVYRNFGYTLPRTSTQQRSAGTGVSYESAQVGDLICYDGHVAIYIGGGLIVHASNSNPYPRGGIKVSNAQYRTILAVRRII